MREYSALIHALREDSIFPSSNEWGLPDLREDRLCDVVPESTWVSGPVTGVQMGLWRSNALPRGLVVAFYTDDYRFESVWHEAVKDEAVKAIAKLEALAPLGLVMPDFSLWQGDPLAVQLWAAYRSRWCARYWQEAGFSVIPSLNWSDAATHQVVAAGIPRRAPVVAVQCRTTAAADKRGRARFLSGLQLGLSALEPRRLLIYGGGSPMHRAWIADGIDFGSTEPVWIESWTRIRNKQREM